MANELGEYRKRNTKAYVEQLINKIQIKIVFRILRYSLVADKKKALWMRQSVLKILCNVLLSQCWELSNRDT